MVQAVFFKFFWPSMVAIISGLAVVNASLFGIKDYCEDEVFQGRCGPDEVIMMQRAVYGRMRLGRCIKLDMGYIGCSQDVLDLADVRCSGRRQCEITVPDSDFEKTRPCLELKSYLEATYSCLKVIPINADDCRRSNYLHLTQQSGYIASVLTHETWCGGSDTPWRIEALPGQRINISLLDFGVQRAVGAEGDAGSRPYYGGAYDSLEVCQKYAVVKEALPQRNTVVCGGRQRAQHVYLSNSNEVEVQIEVRGDSPHQFLLKYDIIGCPDPVVTILTWFKRENDEITIGCHDSDEFWKLTCVGTTWVGDHSNCSQYESQQSMGASRRRGMLPQGLVIATVCGIGIVVGVVVLLVGIVVFRRYRHQQQDVPPTAGKGAGDSDAEEEIYLRPANGKSENCRESQKYREITKDTYKDSPAKQSESAVVCESKNDYTHIWEMPLPVPGGETRVHIAIPISTET